MDSDLKKGLKITGGSVLGAGLAVVMAPLALPGMIAVPVGIGAVLGATAVKKQLDQGGRGK